MCLLPGSLEFSSSCVTPAAQVQRAQLVQILALALLFSVLMLRALATGGYRQTMWRMCVVALALAFIVSLSYVVKLASQMSVSLFNPRLAQPLHASVAHRTSAKSIPKWLWISGLSVSGLLYQWTVGTITTVCDKHAGLTHIACAGVCLETVL